MMFVQTLAVAAVAATFAPFALSQTADAPSTAPTSELYAACEEKLGKGEGHSLLDILEGKFTEIKLEGEDSLFLPLVDAVSETTNEYLMDFDVTGTESYTLLAPLNKDKTTGKPLKGLNSTATLAAADEIVLAHILKGTIDFATLEKKTNATGTWTVPSLQGFEWTFGWSKDGFPYLVDEWNVTKEKEIEITADIKNQPDCPNAIIGIDGFVVTPDLLGPAVMPSAVLDAPAPRSVPAAPDTPTTAPSATPLPSTPTPEAAPNAAGGLSTSSLAAWSAVGAAALGAALL